MKILFISSLYATKEISGAEKIVKILAKGDVIFWNVDEQVHRHGAAFAPCARFRIALDTYYRVIPRAWRGAGTRRSSSAYRSTAPTTVSSATASQSISSGQQNIYSPWPAAAHGFLSRAVWHSLDMINPMMIGRVGAVLDRERPAVVHSHLLTGFTLAPWLAAKRRTLPLVHTMHDWYLRCINSAMYRREQMCARPCAMCRAYRQPHRRASSSVDIPVGVSDFILQHHLKAGFFTGSRAPRVIHNCYDGVINETRSRPTGRPLRFGFLGRLSPSKGVAMFLETFRALGKDGCEVIVGGSGAAAFDGALRSRHADPRITFLGHTDPTEFFHRIDALVVPSLWHEPAPLVVFEAYGNGVPVIASRRGGLTEIVQEDKTGYLFEPNDPGELAGLISRLTDEPAPLDAMRAACIATARHYTNDRMIEAYLAVYREAAEAYQ